MTTFDKTFLVDGAIQGYPCSGPVTTYFGVKDGLHPAGHSGVDIAPSKGAPFYAPGDADVADVFSLYISNPAWASFKATFGNCLILDHGDFYSLYGHMMEPSLLREGMKVKQGDLLGYVGATGYAFDSQGNQGTDAAAHLHWALAKKDNRYFNFPPQLGPVGVLLNPLNYIAATPVDQPPVTPPVQSGWTATVLETETGLTIDVRKP